MHSLIITGGSAPPMDYIQPLLGEASLIVAADSGWNYCREWNIEPHVLVGDMDSIRDYNPPDHPNLKVESHGEDKDHSDTELAMEICAKIDQPIVLIGGGEGRMDHWLALLDLFRRKPAPQRWITAEEDVFLLRGPAILRARPGQQVSIFPVSPGAWNCETRGLKWELDSQLCRTIPHSLSNRMIQSTLEISPGEAELLLILELSKSAFYPSLKRWEK